MQRSIFLAALLATTSPFVSAQLIPDTNAYNGPWTASLIRGNTPVRVADLVIVNFDGTWQDLRKGVMPNVKACRGKKFPITVQVSQEADLAFTVWGSALSPSCPDFRVELKPLDTKTLEGTIDVYGAIKLTRRAAAK